MFIGKTAKYKAFTVLYFASFFLPANIRGCKIKPMYMAMQCEVQWECSRVLNLIQRWNTRCTQLANWNGCQSKYCKSTNFGGYKIWRFSKSFGGNLAAIKFGISPPPVYAVYDRRIYWRRQILAKTRNSPNIIARQTLLIYSNTALNQNDTKLLNSLHTFI